jgi:hypothetical protein
MTTKPPSIRIRIIRIRIIRIRIIRIRIRIRITKPPSIRIRIRMRTRGKRMRDIRRRMG